MRRASRRNCILLLLELSLGGIVLSSHGCSLQKPRYSWRNEAEKVARQGEEARCDWLHGSDSTKFASARACVRSLPSGGVGVVMDSSTGQLLEVTRTWSKERDFDRVIDSLQRALNTKIGEMAETCSMPGWELARAWRINGAAIVVGRTKSAALVRFCRDSLVCGCT
jgi:hypothetical protein